MNRIERGEVIPGVTVNIKEGRREYNAENDEDAAKMIKELFPEVETMRTVTKTTVRPITEIEKEVGKNKLSSICKRKVIKEVKVLDERAKQILQSMNALSIKS